MRVARTILLILMLVPLADCSVESGYEPVSGDIIFQVSRSGQSAAIQLATNSKYSHMGIIFVRDGQPVVFEAVEPVRVTPLDKWIARGEGGHFVVKRLVNASEVLSPEALGRMQAIGDEFAGKHYDLYFEWSDDRIYCSELVWKMYERGIGVEVGALQSLGDFDLSSPQVQEKSSDAEGQAIGEADE